jgi:hypothetical protein
MIYPIPYPRCPLLLILYHNILPFDREHGSMLRQSRKMFPSYTYSIHHFTKIGYVYEAIE